MYIIYNNLIFQFLFISNIFVLLFSFHLAIFFNFYYDINSEGFKGNEIIKNNLLNAT